MTWLYLLLFTDLVVLISVWWPSCTYFCLMTWLHLLLFDDLVVHTSDDLVVLTCLITWLYLLLSDDLVVLTAVWWPGCTYLWWPGCTYLFDNLVVLTSVWWPGCTYCCLMTWLYLLLFDGLVVLTSVWWPGCTYFCLMTWLYLLLVWWPGCTYLFDDRVVLTSVWWLGCTVWAPRRSVPSSAARIPSGRGSLRAQRLSLLVLLPDRLQNSPGTILHVQEIRLNLSWDTTALSGNCFVLRDELWHFHNMEKFNSILNFTNVQFNFLWQLPQFIIYQWACRNE